MKDTGYVRRLPRRVQENKTPIPGPWVVRAKATRQALEAFEVRLRDWYECGMQGDVLDDIVDRYRKILVDTLEKDAETMRGRK